MALAIDASSPVAFSTASAASITSASFTPPSGSLITISYMGNGTTSQDVSVSSVTNTGTAITWARRARKNKNASSDGGAGQEGGAEIWTGLGNGGAITVTVTGVGSGSGFDKFASIRVFTGADTSTFNIAAGSSASGLPSVALSGCQSGSYVIAMASDWAQKGNGTAGTGQTIVAEYNLTGFISGHSWRTTNVLSGAGSQTMNLTAPSAEQYNMVVLEVRDASVGGGGATAIPGRPQFYVPRRRAAFW